MHSAEYSFQLLRQHLASLRRRAILLDTAAGAALALAVGGGAGLVWVGSEALLYLSPAWRAGLGVGMALVALLVLALYLGQRLPARWSLHCFALQVEERCPELKERLISALELWDQRRGQLYSPALLGATVRRAAELLGQAEAAQVVEGSELTRKMRYLGGVAALALMAVVFSETMQAALYRCAHPLTPFARQARTRIAVHPGDLEVVREEDAVVRLRFEGHRPRTAQVLRRETSEAPWQGEELVLEGADSLAYTFSRVLRSFAYQVRAGDGRSEVYQVRVIEPPEIGRLRLSFHYPPYSRLPVRVEEESGDIHALAGTRVDFEVMATKPLSEAVLVLDDTLRRPARLEGDLARVSLEVRHSGHYHFELKDRQGVGNQHPIRYAVQASQDMPPRVLISDPGRDMDLPENRQVLLAAEADDDYGVDKLVLVHRVNRGEEQRRGLEVAPGRKVHLNYVWDLSAWNLLPEDRVYYYLEAFDNDQVAGPKRGISRQYALRFPSLHELLEETAQEQEEHLESLEELAQEGRQTRQYLEQARRELLKSEELSWEKRKELETALEREGQRAKGVEELAARMEETLARMEENGLASQKLLEQLEELRELMAQVATPELEEALRNLQQAMEQVEARQLAEALEKFNQDQRAFQESLERALALLRQVRAEQELEGVVKQAEDLHQRQGQINQELDQGRSSVRLQVQEGNLQRDAERLQQQLQELSQSLEKLSPPTAQGLAAQADTMAAQDLSGRMRRMVQGLRAQANAQARRLGEGLEEDLGRLTANLQQIEAEFKAGQKEQLTQQLKEAMRQLLALSHGQETLQGRARDRQGPALAGLAQEQFALFQGVSQTTERLSQLARRTLSLEHGLAASLGGALRRMQEAAAHLGQQEGSRAAQPQQEAMRHLNEAVLLLRQSLDNLASARMPSGFAEAMQKMLGLSEQQAGLNQATQQAFAQSRQPGQGRSRNLGEEMARLAAEQQRIFQALEELRRALGGSSGAQRRVEAIQEEMREVVADLQRGRLEGRTLNAQNRILQRLLDASRSIHTRGFKEERQSQSGQDRAYAGPAGLPDDLGQAPDALRQALRQALEGPYPEEYRPLIRRYYEQVYQDLLDWEEAGP
jgi:hypothetical protein